VTGEKAPAAVAELCREYAGLAASSGVLMLADLLERIAALAVRKLPSARSARITVRLPETASAVAGVPGPVAAGGLAIPLVGGGELAGMLELAPAGGGFPLQERELAEVLAVLITLTLRGG
jgi:hypothetical protein